MINSKHSHRKLSFVAFNAILSLYVNKQIWIWMHGNGIVISKQMTWPCACVRAFCVLMSSNVYAYLQFYYIVLISIDWTNSNMCCIHIRTYAREHICQSGEEMRSTTNDKCEMTIRHKQKNMPFISKICVCCVCILWISLLNAIKFIQYIINMGMAGCTLVHIWGGEGERYITWVLMLSLSVRLVGSLGRCEMCVKS